MLWECFFAEGWGGRREKNNPFTLRKVTQSPLLLRILCLPSEAFCDGYKHAAVRTQCHSATLSQLDFYSAHSFPSASGEHNKEESVGREIVCGNEPLVSLFR